MRIRVDETIGFEKYKVFDAITKKQINNIVEVDSETKCYKELYHDKNQPFAWQEKLMFAKEIIISNNEIFIEPKIEKQNHANINH